MFIKPINASDSFSTMTLYKSIYLLTYLLTQETCFITRHRVNRYSVILEMSYDNALYNSTDYYIITLH